MNNSELYQLAFQCLISPENSGFDSVFKNKLASNEELVLKFIHLCSNHFIIPAIFKRLKEEELTFYLVSDLVEHLENLFQLNNERNRMIMQQIDEISFHLHKAGIEPVFMKGTANLLDGLYKNPGDRMIGDIYFLVRDNDFLPTAEILLNLGYKTDTEIYDDIKTLKDYPRLFRENSPADIEIHRLPVIPEYSGWFSTESVFKEKKQIQGKINCFVPSDRHKLIQNFIHSQLTNKGHKLRLVSLRDLYDCHLLLKKVSGDEILDKIKERKKAEIYLGFHKAFLKNNFDLSEPDNKSKKFISRHNWFLNHHRLHFFYIQLIKTIDLITTRFLKAFVNRTVFKNLLLRITKREWWQKRLFKGMKEYFS